MIFKVFFRAWPLPSDSLYPESQICKIFAVENGQRLERRIEQAISDLKEDGFKEVYLIDCWNISEPFDPHR